MKIRMKNRMKMKKNEYKSKIKMSLWLRKKWSMGWAGIIWKMINNKQSEKSEKYRNTTWWRLKKKFNRTEIIWKIRKTNYLKDGKYLFTRTISEE